MADDGFEGVALCNKCGFCQAGCPVYKVTGIEWTAARGRVALIKDFLEGRIELDEEMREPLFNCLTCNGCTDHCPPGVPTADIVIRARQEMLRRQGQPWAERMIFRRILPNPGLVEATAKVLRAGQMTGAPSLVSYFHGHLGKANELMPKLPARNAYARLRGLVRRLEHPKHRVAYFMGCAATEVFPAVAVATVRVLHRHRAEVVVPRFVCCGKPPESYGDAKAARMMARQNVDLAARLDVDAIVTACATCSAFLKRYGTLLADDGRYAEKARAFSAKVRDISELLTQIGLNEEMGRLDGLRVTWHDPCHLGRYQKIVAQPRQILKSVPGVELVELPEANMCCGGAGSYNVTHHEISMKVLARKMGHVERSGAGALVTSCPACAIQLGYGLRKHGLPVKMLEIVQVLDEAYRSRERE